jgi:hypothetical protein
MYFWLTAFKNEPSEKIPLRHSANNCYGQRSLTLSLLGQSIVTFLIKLNGPGKNIVAAALSLLALRRAHVRMMGHAVE